MAEEWFSTEEVVLRLDRGRARLLRAVDALGPRASIAFVTEEGGWTANDVLAHLIHYAGQIAFGLGAQDLPPPYVVVVSERLSGQEWNDRAVAYWRDFAPAEVRSEFERVVDRVVEFAALRTDDQMNATDAVPWAGQRPLWHFIGSDTFLTEWPAHSQQIEDVVHRG